MYNQYHSPQKKSKRYPQSASFIRDSSPSRFRNTIVTTEFSERPAISRLRNSFSTQSIKFFDQFLPATHVPKQQRNQTYQNLKNTLSQLEQRIKNVNSKLVSRNFTKKKTKQPAQQQQSEQKYDKNRQTISTQTTTPCLMKISQYITSQPKPANFHPFVSNPYDSKKYSSYYISEAVRAANQKNSLAVEHINGSIKMIQSCSEYMDGNFMPKSKFQMKRLEKDIGKKTLVLDLDETIIHCYENLEIQTDLTLAMNIQGVKVKVGVNIRPYAMTFLKRMAKKFEVVIFTASHESYANAILDQLDPEKQIFSHRFYRNHCIVLPNELHVKDLRYLKRDLKDVVLVDNAAYSYSFQLDNGIPILPFYEGKDFQLTALQHYLETLVQAQDVRKINREYFKLDQYKSFQNAEDLIKSLYIPLMPSK